MNFKQALNAALTEMQSNPANKDNFCCAVYWDANCVDNAIVMFMEYNGYSSMHAVMKDLHEKLSRLLGHPVSICHNNPVDESVLIHGSADDAQVYNSDECCKKNMIDCIHSYLDKPDGYLSEIRSIAKGVEKLGQICSRHMTTSVDDILNTIDWNKDVQAQIIMMLIAHNK